ncbi:MAG: GTP-binding protein [Promethearchaeota archaeon]
MAEKYDFLFKCTILGDGGAGKTAIVVRFSQGFFKENYKMTIGVEFAVKSITVKGSQDHDYNVKLQVWDVGGQDRFQYVRPLYYKGAMGCIILYDVTNRESFDHIPRWVEEIRKEVGEIPTLMVGNKCDLNDQRVVSRKEAEKFAKKLKFLYAESSAKSGTGVGDIFKILALMMIGEEVPNDMIKENLAETLADALGGSAHLGEEKVESLSGNDSKASISSPPSSAPAPAPLSIKTAPKVESKPQFRPSPLKSSVTQDRPSSNPFLQKSSGKASSQSISKEENFAPPTPSNPFKSQSTQENPFQTQPAQSTRVIPSRSSENSNITPSKSFVSRKSFTSPAPTDSNLFTPETPPKPSKKDEEEGILMEEPHAGDKSLASFITSNPFSTESEPFSKTEAVPSPEPTYFAPETPENPFLQHEPTKRDVPVIDQLKVELTPESSPINPFLVKEESKQSPIEPKSPHEAVSSSNIPFMQQSPVKNDFKSAIPFMYGLEKEKSPTPFTQLDPEAVAAEKFDKKREIIEKNLQMNVQSKTFVASTNPFLSPRQSNIPPTPKRNLSENLLAKSEPTTPKQYICDKCGNTMPRKFKYCNKCGAVIK